MTRNALLVAIVVVNGLLLGAQSDPPRFDVASIKPTGAAAGVGGFSGSGLGVRPGGAFSATNSSVLQLIRFAYDLLVDDQVIGGPDWIRSERFTVTARASTDAPREQVPRMVQALLADRFRLRVRNENREMPIFELRLARSDGRVGPNLHDCSRTKVPEEPFRAPSGGTVAVSDCASGLRYLATLVSRRLQTTVVDKTGLTGQWWFNIYYGGELPAIPGVDLSKEKVNPDLPSFEGALREQLGLRLERTRGPVPVVVIDSVERPTPD